MGWQVVNGERKYVWDHFQGPTPSARRQALKAEALDAFIEALGSATPQEIKQYVQNNTGDINEVRILLTKLAVALAYALERR